MKWLETFEWNLFSTTAKRVCGQTAEISKAQNSLELVFAGGGLARGTLPKKRYLVSGNSVGLVLPHTTLQGEPLFPLRRVSGI